MPQDVFLYLNAVGEPKLAFDGVRLAPARQQPITFCAAERVAGVDLRDAEQKGELPADVARVRVVTVDQIRESVLLAEQMEAAVHQLIEMRPQELLAHVPVGGPEG